MNTMTRSATEEIQTVNREIRSVIRALGGNQQRYRRERSRAVKLIVRDLLSSEGDSRDQAVAGAEAYSKIRSGLDYC